jgi:hypothetical protein
LRLKVSCPSTMNGSFAWWIKVAWLMLVNFHVDSLRQSAQQGTELPGRTVCTEVPQHQLETLGYEHRHYHMQ